MALPKALSGLKAELESTSLLPFQYSMSTLLKLQVAQITDFSLPHGNVSPFSPVALLHTSEPVAAAG